MSVKLSYSFAADTPLGTPFGEFQLDNPLFAMLAAIHDGGSLGQAATRLRLPYRHVWSFVKTQGAGLGVDLLAGGHGPAARLSAIGERLLWAERRMSARHLPSAESLAARLDRELLLAVDPGLCLLPTCASHDLLFGALRDRLRRHARVLLDLDYVGSSLALERLNDGQCQLAGMHLPADEKSLCQRGSALQLGIGRHLRLGEHKLIRFARREQGLIVARGNPLGVRSLKDLARPGLRFVNREPGCGTRLLLDALLASDSVAIPAGDSEPTHLSVAACVAAGAADCGFGLRAAAARCGLDFIPVVGEQYFLVCRKPQLERREIAAIIEILQSDNFRRLANAIPGYNTDDAGEIVSLRRTLPWYK